MQRKVSAFVVAAMVGTLALVSASPSAADVSGAHAPTASSGRTTWTGPERATGTALADAPGRGYLQWNSTFNEGHPPADLLARPLTDVALGLWFGLAMLPGGEVTGWGIDGALAIPWPLSAGARSIAAGQCHGLAVDAQGMVQTVDAFSPNGECAAPQAPSPIPSALSQKVTTHVAAGGAFSAAMTADGEMHLWGDTAQVDNIPAGIHRSGGLRSLDAITFGGYFGEALTAVTTSGDLYSWGVDEYGRVSEVPNGPLPGVTFVESYIGGGATIALSADGDVHVFSTLPDLTRIPQGARDNRIVAIGTGDATLWAVDEDGTVYTWGELLDLGMSFPVKKVTGGTYSRAALYSPGSIDAQPRSGVLADGTSSATVTVTARDLGAAPVAGTPVVLWRDGAPTGVSGTTGPDGTFTTRLTSTTAGPVEVSAVVDGVLTNEVRVVFDPPPVIEPSVQLSTITATSPVTANGSDFSTATVTVRDVDDVQMPSGGLSVSVDARSGPGLLAPSAVTIGAVKDNNDGTYTAEVRSATVGTARLGFSVDQTSSTTSVADVVFAPGPVDTTSSQVSAAPASITADGTSTSTITVDLTDATGHGLTGQDVALTTTAGTVSMPVDQGDGTYTATLTSSTRAATATVRVRLDGAATTLMTDVTFTPGVAVPGASTITAEPTAIAADGASTSTITATLVDAHGNGVPGGDVVVTTTAGSITTTDDLGDGTYTATLTSSTTLETATVGLTVSGTAAGPTATVDFVAGSVLTSASTIAADPTSITADGTSTSTVTVTLTDETGHRVAGQDVTITTDAGNITTTDDQGDGTYTATLTSSTTSETATLGFQLDGSATGPTTEVTFTPGSAVPGAATITADPTSITADGVSTSTITITLVDAFGNGVPDRDVVATTTAGALSTTQDLGDGRYSAALTSSTVSETATLGLELDGTSASATTEVTFTAGAAVSGAATISADPTSITADGTSTSTITVTLVDAHGNGVAGSDLVMTASAGTITTTDDHGDGTYTATLTSSTTTETATVGFQLDGTAGTTTTDVAFTPGDPDQESTTITADPVSITADGVSTSTITVTLVDAHGNATPAHDVVITSSAGTVSPTDDLLDGTYTAVLTSSTTGQLATVGLTIDGTAADPTTEVLFTVGAVVPEHSTITADPTSITADGASTSTITVTLVDAHGNGAPSQDVVLTTTAGQIAATQDLGGGHYSAVLTSTTTLETAVVGFVLDGTAGDATAEVAFVAGDIDMATASITAEPSSIPADGTSTSTITVTVADAASNPVAGRNLAITTTAGTVSATTDNLDGTYTATLTSTVTATTATVGILLDDAAEGPTTEVQLTEVPSGGEESGEKTQRPPSETTPGPDATSPTGPGNSNGNGTATDGTGPAGAPTTDGPTAPTLALTGAAGLLAAALLAAAAILGGLVLTARRRRRS